VFSPRLVVAVVLGTISTAAPAEDAFKLFTSKEGKFTVLMPGQPKEEKSVDKAGATEVTTNMFTCEVDSDRVVLVGFSELPPASSDPANVDKVLDASAGSTERVVKGKILSLEKISLGKHPGREVQIEVPESKWIVKVHYYLVGTRLYQVYCIGPASYVRSADLDRFYKSFKVNE
jgi:hypothetical protein